MRCDMLNNRLFREKAMASNPKMEYQVFLCIFPMNSAMASVRPKPLFHSCSYVPYLAYMDLRYCLLVHFNE